MKTKHKFKVITGYDFFNGSEIYRLIGINNDHFGEWHTSKQEAENEINNL